MKFKLLIKNKYISSFIGTFSLIFGIAFIFPLSNFSVYITSYIHMKDDYVTIHHGLFINLIYTLANTFSFSLGGYLETLIGFTPTMIVGIIITFLINIVFIFLQNIWLCYFSSFIIGMGAGISTSLLGKNLVFYRPNKKGIISGIIGIGIMIISAIFALGGEKIINFEGETFEENQHYYSDEVAKKTYLYFLIGEFCIPIGLIFALLLIYEYKPGENNEDNSNIVKNENGENNENNENIVKNENGENNENNENIIKKENENGEKNTNNEEDEKEKELKTSAKTRVKKVIKSLRFWKLTLISFLINIPISFMVYTGRTFGALIGINGNALQFAGLLQVLAVLILGPLLGMIVDKKGPLLIIRIISISCIIPGILLTFFMSNSFIFIPCFVLYVLNIASLAVSFGPFIMEVYGIQESVIIGGIINGFSKFGDVATTVSAFGFSLVCDKEKDCLKLRYAYMYFISAICCILSSLLLFFENNEKYNYDDIQIDDLLIENEKNDLQINTDEGNGNENKVTEGM